MAENMKTEASSVTGAYDAHSASKVAMAATNWNDLVNLCIGQEREKRRSSIQRAGKRASANLVPPQQMKPPAARYMPTYRLDPKVPFNTEICEKIMKEVMDQAFDNFQYSQKNSLTLCAQLSEEIKVRVKLRNYDRYRYICIVTIGEKVMQGFYSMTNFLWDATKDGYLKYIYDTPQFFAIAVFYYIYYD